MKSLIIKWDRRAGLLSLMIGIYLSSVLSFRYLPINVDSHSLVVRVLSFFDDCLDGYGILGMLSGLMLSGGVYLTLQHMKERAEKPKFLLYAISLLFGVLNVFGLMMYHMDDLPFFESTIWGVATIYLIFGWAILFFLIAHWVLWGLEHLSENAAEKGRAKNRLAALFESHPWAMSFAVIFLCWLPWMIIYYPASMDWDVYRQLCSALALEPFARSNHDPWLASLVLTGFYKLGEFFGDKNLGIFLFVLVRNIIIVSIYAHGVALLRKAKVRSWICTAVMLFYAVTPVWGAYSKHAFKDTFAAALFCAYMISLVTVILKGRAKDLRWTDCIGYCLWSAAAALFRNNPIYAILPATVLLLIFLITQKIDWKKCVVLSLGVVICLGFNHYIFNCIGIKKSSAGESLSVLFQQTARTVKYHENEITEEEKQSIGAILDYNILAKDYDPVISDPIKRTLKKEAGEEELASYKKTWCSMLFKYPDTYLESFFGGSYGYYAFTPKLPPGSGNMNSGMTIFNWIDVAYFRDLHGLDFDYIDAFREERDALHVWSNIWDSLPLLSLTDTIAAYTWFAILIGIALIQKKRWPELIAVLAVGILFLTCVASPVNDAFRYYSPVAASIPALLILLGSENKFQKRLEN